MEHMFNNRGTPVEVIEQSSQSLQLLLSWTVIVGIVCLAIIQAKKGWNGSSSHTQTGAGIETLFTADPAIVRPAIVYTVTGSCDRYAAR